MYKIAIMTKTVVFGIDYRTPQKEGDDVFGGQKDFAHLIKEVT